MCGLSISFFKTDAWNTTVWLYLNLSGISPTRVHWDCFQYLPLIKQNTVQHETWYTPPGAVVEKLFSGTDNYNETAGSRGVSIVNLMPICLLRRWSHFTFPMFASFLHGPSVRIRIARGPPPKSTDCSMNSLWVSGWTVITRPSD